MTSIPIQEKSQECQRIITNISRHLPAKLATLLHLQSLEEHDFIAQMKLVRGNFQMLAGTLQGPLTLQDIKHCMKIRHTLSHQQTTSISYLNRALHSLRLCQKAFGIQSALIPLRVLACRTCDQVITRTAQPSTQFKDIAGQKQKVTRTYDVQSWVIGNVPGELASRENAWYPGWVSTRTACSRCHSHIGYRFDWAPEDRVDLTQVTITYNLNPRQAMIVTYPDGTIKDLTHVVSDGEVRRHRYGLFESALREVT
jgi:hypothetical protein